MPLVLGESEKIMTNLKKSLTPTKLNKNVPTLQAPELMQLPIERLNPISDGIYNKEACVFCEYLLHYAQQAITNPSTEV